MVSLLLRAMCLDVLNPNESLSNARNAILPKFACGPMHFNSPFRKPSIFAFLLS